MAWFFFEKPLQMFGFPQDLHDIYFVSCGIFTIAYAQKHYSLKDLFLSNWKVPLLKENIIS